MEGFTPAEVKEIKAYCERMATAAEAVATGLQEMTEALAHLGMAGATVIAMARGAMEQHLAKQQTAESQEHAEPEDGRPFISAEDQIKEHLATQQLNALRKEEAARSVNSLGEHVRISNGCFVFAKEDLDLWMTHHSPPVMSLIREIREATGLNLKDAKELFDRSRHLLPSRDA